MTYKPTPFARLGELVSQLTDQLKANKSGSTVARIMAFLATSTGYTVTTIYRWQEGRLRPSDETLRKLAEIGRNDAGLPRQWGEEFFRAARLPNSEEVVNEIWGGKNIREILNSLPPPNHTTFVGRQAEMKRLIELLSPDRRQPLITIDGIGGVGKTALVLEVAHRCLRASTGESFYPGMPTFDAIIFVSAKSEVLTSGGILAKSQSYRTLRNIFGVIAHTLRKEEITHVPPNEQLRLVTNALGEQTTLLIVDNLETMENKQGVIEFLYDLPASVKVVITTRESELYYSPIRLGQLQVDDGEHLIKHEAADKGVELNDDQIKNIYKRSGGVPAAIIYAVGQLASGYSVETVLYWLGQKEGDIARFCFEESVRPLRGQPAHRILMAAAIFPKEPLSEAVVSVAGLLSNEKQTEDALVKLFKLSLLKKEEDRLSMLPLTREFAWAELSSDEEFEAVARERWVRWYLNFSKQHGGSDQSEWHIQYDYIEDEWENLIAVFDWCASKDRYEDVKAFWQDDRVDDCANLYGFWDDRLRWKDWLVGAAEKRGDWETVVSARSSKGCTLALIAHESRLREATIVLEQAWKLHPQASAETNAYLSNHIAMLRILEKNFSEAHRWLDIQDEILDEGHFEETRKTRAHANLLYYRGVAFFRENQLPQAKTCFNKMIEEAVAVNWERGVVNAKNWLADIAICEGDLKAADQLLQTGLPIVERNKDRRRAACYKRSFASYEFKKGNVHEALRWCEEAMQEFDRLGMQPETEEMNFFAKELRSKFEA